jgi:hypothetical protein
MVHRHIDPLWTGGFIDRKHLYAKLSAHIGKTYHTANITTVAEAIEICDFAKSLVELK